MKNQIKTKSQTIKAVKGNFIYVSGPGSKVVFKPNKNGVKDKSLCRKVRGIFFCVQLIY